MKAIQRLADGNNKCGGEDEKQKLYDGIGLCSKRCRGCAYGTRGKSAPNICNYIIITGHRRPCKAGAHCTEYVKAKAKKKGDNGQWSKAM